MSDPYAPPGSRRETGPSPHGHDVRRQRRELPPSVPHRPAPERRPPDPEAATRTARLGLRFSLLIIAGLVALTLPLPWRLGGAAFIVIGAVVGVFALVSAVKARLRWTAVLVLSVGLGMAALLLLVEALNLVFWPLTVERQQCLDTALTTSAVEQCHEDYQDGVQRLLPSVPAPPTTG
ncbi:hypothetical protein SAMN06264364_10340 [Quadrisphaera granulorum]|uniref:Uncharacterized protein n=1 Tax=Quadrisphaera granulorum TaxID=317664 RepID=A0A316AEG3_9ACTN|nr:DUF308 domain-containing protein [Quadrisphaera granulorum]PWJ55370.1 hypothetical protein BXY45_10340 [Quadrisphaera granulorum]SZE95434.1 hypothetical protein SAMN06264364_10340 [Quadrisphaera granulorum]